MSGRFIPDKLDIAILQALQEEIPLVSRPWKEISGKIGISEQELLARLNRIKNAGILKAVSPIIESSECGRGAATLVAMHVPSGRLQEVAAIISGYPEVSHNFRREHYYQVWFTLSGRDEEHIRVLVRDILERTGIGEDDILDLPTVNKLKVDVRFSFHGTKATGGNSGSC
ncbi:MAG TPA: Lrp/AsnC family transcriptional regulator [Methanolinea sp.]|jgi:DNA-binding Lrp family transcriptional regulator|nr:MAG: putative HTH-type transcriptional regulator [Methanoregulaceae archaeon PtaB.Bin009]OPY41230.1 MAG: putative HTH-type transcriptional regulator [Methanoregulaceae archaeon PtaU1.Bin066]HII76148.1 Lrp/AsnC family transcriptional regulator [Methanolinea sp.]HNQ29628.1 AsnC family transcriptional regulator [Methanolinea sp.]